MQTYKTQLKAIEGDDDDDAGGVGDECDLLLYALKVKRMLTCLHQSTRLPLILSLSLCTACQNTNIRPVMANVSCQVAGWKNPPELTSRYQQYGPRNNTIQYCDPKSHLSLYDVII